MRSRMFRAAGLAAVVLCSAVSAQGPGTRGQENAAIRSQRAAAALTAAEARQATARSQQRAAQAQRQIQARVQADAARAAQIARQATAMTRRDALVGRGRSGRDAGRRPDAQTRGGISAVTVARTNAADRRLSKQDMEIFDNIFGQFNPFRARESQSGVKQPLKRETLPSNTQARPEASAEDRTGFRGGRATDAQRGRDFGRLIQAAARQRRAEISEMRDQALQNGNVDSLLKAHRAERSLDEFLKAQARVRSNTENTPAKPGVLSRQLPGVIGRPLANDASAEPGTGAVEPGDTLN